eukprot:CAMPEP_0206500944 /NCGR_PEP_ID=MMETSP0324_2-20121206/52953_1 /ASSEMBLY_ACC=CAM_ASM_000836 /TAXON_ID=2866 /ORGANISM="Crypthecodinium cohnii, Strain Seligo" /LENGTH=64 /DNA_ID=CAMNT_0053988543 /DNA_START=87 /DNA_END=281 /DNA_ORIENTATION=+
MPPDQSFCRPNQATIPVYQLCKVNESHRVRRARGLGIFSKVANAHKVLFVTSSAGVDLSLVAEV